MSNLEKAKKIIKDNFEDGSCGIYNTGNFAGDRMETLYETDELEILICPFWAYFEVFGLTDEEFKDLKDFYRSLSKSYYDDFEKT